MPVFCGGFSELIPCIYNTGKIGGPAQSFQGKDCLFCDADKMQKACDTVRGRQHVTRALKFFRAHYETHNYVYNSAMMLVPDEWRDDFHAKALKTKRGAAGRPRGPRAAAAGASSVSAAKAWTEALVYRKRAFCHLGNNEVTAYKKRRKADRNRVEKKFFLDNNLPKPEPNDVAKNDSGLPAPSSSERAAFAELWCQYGSWAICRSCHAVRPRPMQPIDTRRVAPAEVSAKACKVCCNGNHWVPQRAEIPKVLRKLSVKLLKVLRPLDIDVGPVQKANNGYRIHSRMIRFSWSKLSVEDKIDQAPFHGSCCQ